MRIKEQETRLTLQEHDDGDDDGDDFIPPGSGASTFQFATRRGAHVDPIS